MEYRANYAIKKNSEIKLYYSHWNALRIPEFFFWGPAYAEDFILTNSQVNIQTGWVDEVFGKGGACMDKDKKKITLFSQGELGRPPLRTLFLKLMKILWKKEKWDVIWADNMRDIVKAAGINPDIVKVKPILPHPIKIDRIGSTFKEIKPNYYCIVIIATDDITIKNVADFSSLHILANGPIVLNVLQNLPSLDNCIKLFKRTNIYHNISDSLTDIILIWKEKKVLEFKHKNIKEFEVDFIKSEWNDWNVKLTNDSIQDVFLRLNQEIPAELKMKNKKKEENNIFLPFNDSIKKIKEILINNADEKNNTINYDINLKKYDYINKAISRTKKIELLESIINKIKSEYS